ncbi:hypothetical protein D4R86_00705 [bacterium]|nr:MAG: hypothetical protein D4R86_00705 [bacterium]
MSNYLVYIDQRVKKTIKCSKSCAFLFENKRKLSKIKLPYSYRYSVTVRSELNLKNMRKIEFIPGEYYHIYDHGVEERKVFVDEYDFKRALVCLGVFNDTKPSPEKLFRFVKNPLQLTKRYNPDNRDRLVDIIAFTLLPTHYHFFLQERQEKGISRFMHCFNKGYARYFNLKYERRGTLWESAFGAKLIDNEAYFTHIMTYIHLNILDLHHPQWREGNIKNWEKVAGEMKNYPWSSYSYYRTGKSDPPFLNLIITKPDWLSEYYPKLDDFEKDLRLWSLRNTGRDISDLL